MECPRCRRPGNFGFDVCPVCEAEFRAEARAIRAEARATEEARMRQEEAAERRRREREEEVAERARFDQEHWLWSQSTGTTEAYEKYLASCPYGKHVTEAKAHLDSDRWWWAQKEGTIQALEQYLVFCPYGEHVAEAKAQLDRKRWPLAQKEGTIEAYEQYLAACPGGAHVAEANAQLDGKRWLLAFREGTIQGYEKYLTACPNGGHVAEANSERTRLDEESWRLSQIEGTIEGYERYLAISAKGAHVSEAKQFLSSRFRDMLLANLDNVGLRKMYLAVRTEEYKQWDNGWVPKLFSWVVLVVGIIIGVVACLVCSWLEWWWPIGIFAGLAVVGLGISLLLDKSAKFGPLPPRWYFFSESELRWRIWGDKSYQGDSWFLQSAR